MLGTLKRDCTLSAEPAADKFEESPVKLKQPALVEQDWHPAAGEGEGEG